ncbi:MAG: hydrogenase 4 subunit F [Candidatus Methanoperedens sp.]|nr:hydrogenase 4 subunit F [Candidatus Methanoperedens sp.]
MSAMIEYMLFSPILTSFLCFLTKTRRQVEIVSLSGSIATLVLGLALVADVYRNGMVVAWQNALFADAFGAFIVLVVSIVGFVASVYSMGYMGHELEHKIIDLVRLRMYYVLFHIFMFTMLLVGVTNNLGLWIAIEMTTLVSALLMILYSRKSSVEAAWKYMIICTVGITFALFGTILTYYGAVKILGENGDALNWTSLAAVADQLDPTIMKLAFIFILIGYGTKAGLAPMHTWLPDAHSEAPTPVSALLSGVLLNCAMYGIIRFYSIATKSTGAAFSSNLLIIFGLLSLGIAVPFIILQEDYKRLLAYSSVEHMGIVALGLGFGGVFGVFGAMPATGTMFVIGGLAITGSPPFSIFISEFTILAAGFSQGYIIPAVLFLLFIIMIFAGFFYHVSRIAFGSPGTGITAGEVSRWTLCSMAILLVFVLLLGFYIPPQFYDMIMKVVEVVR